MLRLTTLGGLRLERDGATLTAVRPRRLALLAVLAAAEEAGLTRDSLLAILWTDSAPERARHSLAQATYALRRELNCDVIPPGPTLRLDPAAIATDLAELRQAVGEERMADADALYRGPFLDGFYLAEAPEFERWVDEERVRIHRAVVTALEGWATKHADERGAEAIWDRLTKLEPLNGRFAAAFMNAKARSGDRAAALAHGESHARLLKGELDVPPDDAVLASINQLRTHVAAKPRRSTSASRRSTPLRLADDGSLPKGASNRRRWRRATAAALLLVLAGALGAALWQRLDHGSSGRTGTALAARLHDGGLRAFYQGEYGEARRLFDAALAADSSFGEAAYFAWRTELAADGPNSEMLASLALAKARNADAHDGRLVAAHVGLAHYDIGAAALLDSLANQFPNDPEVLMRASEATGDLPHAVALLERALAADSATASAPTAICRACETLRMLATRYAWADSSAAVLRTFDRWSAMRPFDYSPWLARFEYLMKLDRTADADAALRRADSLGVPRSTPSVADVERHIRTGAFGVADSLCRASESLKDSTAQRARLRTMCVVNLRAQGRLRAALASAREAGEDPLPTDPDLAAALDVEMNRPLMAAAWHSRAATEMLASDTSLSGAAAHAAVWHLAAAAAARAQARDTIRLRALVDSVELLGHRSADARDALLHHYLRGLLLASAADHEAAVREYRLASAAPAHDFSRIEYDMARSLMAAHRPLEALPPLRAVLHGAIDGAGLTLSPTDARLLLAEAFDSAGQRDSAAVHYAAVANAWRAADPVFAERYGRVRAALLRTQRVSR